MKIHAARSDHAVAGIIGGYAVGLPVLVALLADGGRIEPEGLILLLFGSAAIPMGALPAAWLSDRVCERHEVRGRAAGWAAFAAGGAGAMLAPSLLAAAALLAFVMYMIRFRYTGG